jgi:hypothetical protein
MPRQLISFSTLALVYHEEEKQMQQRQLQQQVKEGQQQAQQDQDSLVPPLSISHPIQRAFPENQTQTQTQSASKEEKVTKQKIIIKKRHSSSCSSSCSRDEKKEQKEKNEEKQEVASTKTKIKIVIKSRKMHKYSDIAPPTTSYYNVSNDIYQTPPPNCCRFFIENRHCFLRQRDNACICPKFRTVIGFWNEKVGKECKLLPIEDETMYEEATIVDPLSSNIPTETAPVPRSPTAATTSPTAATTLPSKNSNSNPITSKSKIVSDAQRARIASEPVALLREKLAKQYGISKKN